MEFYSPDKELKDTFDAEIKNAEYISAVNQFCKKLDTIYYDVKFIPHNLLTEWNNYIKQNFYGDEPFEEEFQLDMNREVLFNIENEKLFLKFPEHQTFLHVLGTIDKKFKEITFIPAELQNEKRWWNASIYKKGTKEYKENIEDYIYDRFKKRITLKERIELI